MAQAKVGDEKETGAPPAGAAPPTPQGPAEEFHQLLIRFQNLMVQSPHVISLRDGFGVWSMGPGRPQRGLTVATPNNEPVHLSQMGVTETTITIVAAPPTRALDVTVFVRTNQRLILGGVVLPPGPTMMLRSSYDQTNVVGIGSWALLLGEPR